MVEPLKELELPSVTTVSTDVTSRGAYRIVPVRPANADGDQNEYTRTKEIGLDQGCTNG